MRNIRKHAATDQSFFSIDRFCHRLLLSGFLTLAISAGQLSAFTADAAFAVPNLSGAPVDAKGTDGGNADKPADADATAASPTSSSTTTNTTTSTTTSTSAPAPASSTNDTSTPTTSTAETSSTAGSALQGGVATTEASAEAILVELEDTVKHLKDASWGAFTEAQRPDVIFIGGPNVIGGAVIPAIGGNGMVSSGGYLPPRKKWIDYYSLHVNYLAPMLKQELESFKLPPGVSSDTTADMVEYDKIGERLPDLCSKMLTACQGPKYDNMTIVMAAGMLNEELKRYDKERKKILKDIREDFKHTAEQDKKDKEAEKEHEKKEKEEQK